ncbi:MAG: DUF4136 domain-containing protein [Bacteroidota bacterium]
MKKMQWIMATTIGVLILSACSQRAYVQKDDTVDFTKIKTYTWVYGTQKDSLTKQPKVNDLVDRKIRESIDRNLQKNGWKEVNRNPDVLLVYDVDVQRENRTVSDPVYTMPTTRWFFNPYSRRYVPVYYPSQFMGYDNRKETVKEGTITLTLMKASNDKTIWQGWTSSEINGKRMTDKEINDNVKAIVKKLG